MRRNRKSMLIGITGLIGSGKSEAARIFSKYGAFVISADRIGKDVVDNNKTILNRLIRAFGTNIITKTGRLRRKKLGELAFSSEVNKIKLNKIVHPALLRKLSAQVNDARNKYDVIVIDAALLINWGWHKKVDLTILIHASYRKRIHRLMQNGYTEVEALQRTKSQFKFDELSKDADITLLNNKTPGDLEKKIRNIIDRFPEIG